MQPKAAQLGTDQLANVMWSFAHVGYTSEDLFQELARWGGGEGVVGMCMGWVVELVGGMRSQTRQVGCFWPDGVQESWGCGSWWGCGVEQRQYVHKQHRTSR